MTIKYHQYIILGILALFTVAGCRKAPAIATPVADPLQRIPGQALFCVRINNLDKSLTQLDSFLLGVSPISLSMVAKAKLGQLLGNPGFAGLRMDGDWLVFGLALSEQPQDLALGILVPVTDYSHFAEQCSLYEIGSPPHLDSLTIENRTHLYGADLANYVLLCPDATQISTLRNRLLAVSSADSLQARWSSTSKSDSSPTGYQVYGNLQTLYQNYGDLLLDKLHAAQLQIENLNAQQADPNTRITLPQLPSAAQLQRSSVGLTLIAHTLKVLSTQCASLTLNMVPDAMGLHLRTTLQASSNSALAQSLSTQRRIPDPNLLPHLQPETAMSMWGHWGLDFFQWSWTLFEPWFAQHLTTSQIQEIQTSLTSARQVFRGDGVLSMQVQANTKPWFTLQYVLPITSQQAWDSLLSQHLQLFNEGGLGEAYKTFLNVGLNMDVQHEAETYQGIPIDAATARFAVDDPNSADAQVLASLYGEGLTYRMAVIDQLLLITAGANDSNAIHDLINRVQGPKNQIAPHEFSRALDILPEAQEADVVMTYNSLRIFQALRDLFPLPLPELPMPSQSNLIIAGRTGEQTASLDVVLPKDHLMEIVQFFMAIQMQIQMNQQPKASPTQP